MSVRVWTSAVALACVVMAAQSVALAEGVPYKGREAAQARTYGARRASVPRPAVTKPAAAPALATTPPIIPASLIPAPAPASAPIKAVSVAEGMKLLSSEDLADAMGDGTTRTQEIDGAAHDNVLKIGGRTSEAASRIEGATFTRLTPEPPPQVPEGLIDLGAGGFTIIQSRGF